MANNRLFPPLAALRAFEAVGRLGGIRKAGKELGTDHAVVSRHIRSLETWVGATLMVRENGSYRLTDAGSAYHQEVYKALSLIGAATGALMEPKDQMRLHIWCIPGFGFLWLSDRLGEFIACNPDIDLDFRPADDSPDFRAKDVDGAIRYVRTWQEGQQPRQVHALEFARPPVFPVASPEFAASMKPLRTAADLLDYCLLHEDNDEEWRHWLASQHVALATPLPGPRLWHAHLTLNAARQGQGIALANTMLLRDDIARGRLVRLESVEKPFRAVSFGGYSLLAREDRWNAAALVRFRRWLRDSATRYQKEVCLG